MKRRLIRYLHDMIYRQHSVTVVVLIAVTVTSVSLTRLPWWIQVLIWFGMWIAADVIQWLLGKIDRKLPAR